MDHPSQKLLSLAATARIANAPSVIGNVLLGSILAVFTSDPQMAPVLMPTLVTCGIGIALYFSGNFLNDWADIQWDSQHRPERALPRGLFKPQHYLTTAIGLSIASLAAAASISIATLAVTCAIIISIITYTYFHKRSAGSVIPMGLCRAFLPTLGYTALVDPFSIPPFLGLASLGLFSHIVGLSLSARAESKPNTSIPTLVFAKLWFLPAALCPFIAAYGLLGLPATSALCGLIPYLTWIVLCLTRLKRPVATHVSYLLAGIPLVDWILLLPLGLELTPASTLTVACLIISPLALFAGKTLQKLAPAT